MEGYIKVNMSSQSQSDDFNNSFVGALNTPLIDDELALRVTAYRFDNAGYVDAVSTPSAESIAAATGSTVIVEDDIGGSTYTGARATLLWTATEKLDITLTLGTQEIEIEGAPEIALGSEGYSNSYLNTPHGKNEAVDFDYGNLLIEYDLGWASLTSASSLLQGQVAKGQNFFGTFPDSLFGPSSLNQVTDSDRFVEEIRLASQFDGPLQFVAGLFYEDYQTELNSQNNWDGTAPNPFGSNPLIDATVELDLTQKAVFGEVSYAFNEQWELTVGGRYFDYDRVDTTIQRPSAFFAASIDPINASDTGTTFKTNLSFTPNDHTLLYAQWSEGFRLGKGQTLPPLDLCDIAPEDGKLDGTDADLTNQIDPDRTENIELGAKFTLLDNNLTLNTAVFNIDWSDLPSYIRGDSPSCPVDFGITNNIGKANSKGVEVDVNYLVTSQLSVNLSASYVEAEWKDTTGITAESGESLSFAPRTNASMGLQYSFDMSSYPAFARADINYVGEYENGFKSSGFPTSGDYVNANLRLGIDIDQWSLALYVTNLTDEDSSIASAVSDIRVIPRRLGLEANYTF